MVEPRIFWMQKILQIVFRWTVRRRSAGSSNSSGNIWNLSKTTPCSCMSTRPSLPPPTRQWAASYLTNICLTNIYLTYIWQIILDMYLTNYICHRWATSTNASAPRTTSLCSTTRGANAGDSELILISSDLDSRLNRFYFSDIILLPHQQQSPWLWMWLRVKLGC